LFLVFYWEKYHVPVLVDFTLRLVTKAIQK